MKDHPTMWYREMTRLHKKIAYLPNQDDLTVFYGSSSIRLWVNIREDLAPLNVINIGFGGSSYKWLGYYFDELFADLHPKMIIFYAGENDLHNGATPSQVQNDFLKLAHTAKSRFPEATLHCITLKPSPSRKILGDKIKNTNRLLNLAIKQFEGGKLINLHDPMLDANGDARLDLYLKDHLHLNKKGYAVWRSVLRKFLDLDP